MGNIFKCSRGFLIERREDGKFTPFFVKVRAVDIVDSKGKPIFPSGDVIDGTVTIKEKDDWNIRDYSGKFYEATKTININEMYFTKDSDTELSGIITIPKPIFISKFAINITMSGNNDALATSFINTVPVVDDNKVVAVKISLRNLTYTYPNKWNRDASYDTSNLYIRVSGR